MSARCLLPASVIFLVLLVVAAQPGVAQTTVGTAAVWNGTDSTNPSTFGEGGATDATFGQTFTAPSGVGSLSSFTFFVGDANLADEVHFQAFVMAWDGLKATGPVLFQSGAMSYTDLGLGGFQRFDVSISGGLKLNAGATYVAFFSASNLFDGVPGDVNFGADNSASYGNGGFVSLNNGSNFSAVTTNNWDQTFFNLLDLAFELVFASPESGGEEVEELPIIMIVDGAAISSVLFSSVPTALAQRELALGASRVTLRDFNSRLFRRRAGAGADPRELERTYYDLTVGEGDGIEHARDAKGAKVVYGVARPDAAYWEVFTSFDYGGLSMDADRNFLGLQSDTYAESVGVELALAPNLFFGAGGAYLESNADRETDIEGVTLATYVSGVWNGLHADLLYGATLLDHDIDRNTGFGSTARAQPGSVTHTVSFNTGDYVSVGHWTMGPFLGLDYARAEIDGYTESGGDTAATRVSEQSVDSLISRVGYQVSRRFDHTWGSITPQVRVSWERENLSSDDDLTVGLLQSPYYLVQGRSIRSTGEAFEATVSSQDRARDYLTVGAGVLVDLGGTLDVVLDYAGDFFANGYAAHYGKVSLGWKF